MTPSYSFQMLAQTATETAQATAQAKAQTEAARLAAESAASFASYLVWGVAIVTLIAVIIIYRNVRRATDWSLTDALSEEVDITTRNVGTDGLVLRDAEGKFLLEKVMRASSSRLIAFFGTIVIMMLYVGAGIAVLHRFAVTGTIPPDAEKLTTFLVSGMVLFAPYIVNKFSAVFGATK